MENEIKKLEALDKRIISELDVVKSFIEAGEYSFAVLKLKDLERATEKANNFANELADKE